MEKQIIKIDKDDFFNSLGLLNQFKITSWDEKENFIVFEMFDMVDIYITVKMKINNFIVFVLNFPHTHLRIVDIEEDKNTSSFLFHVLIEK